MYCSKCGKEIDNEAVICVHCGVATQNMFNKKEQPIIINNSASSSASAASSSNNGRIRKKHSLLLDIILIFLTGGLWIFWMIFRPKYE